MSYQGGFLGLKAMFMPLNPMDAVKEFAYAFGLAHADINYSRNDAVGSTVPLESYRQGPPLPSYGRPGNYYNA